MHKLVVRLLVLLVLQISLVGTMTTSLFASEPIFTLVPTGITGRVWLDVNGSGNPEQAEAPLANLPVFIQRLDDEGFAMTLVVYTDEVGGYAIAGLPAGTYQIWTETASDGVFLLIVTLDDSTPTATANLPMAGYRLFLPAVMQ